MIQAAGLYGLRFPLLTLRAALADRQLEVQKRVESDAADRNGVGAVDEPGPVRCVKTIDKGV